MNMALILVLFSYLITEVELSNRLPQPRRLTTVFSRTYIEVKFSKSHIPPPVLSGKQTSIEQISAGSRRTRPNTAFTI